MGEIDSVTKDMKDNENQIEEFRVTVKEVNAAILNERRREFVMNRSAKVIQRVWMRSREKGHKEALDANQKETEVVKKAMREQKQTTDRKIEKLQRQLDTVIGTCEAEKEDTSLKQKSKQLLARQVQTEGIS